MSESFIDFLNYKVSYGFGIIIAVMLHRYVERQVFPTQKFQHSERLFWANLLLFCQMLNVGFVFVGFLIMNQESKIVPDLIFETVFLVLIGFIAFGGIDGEINFSICVRLKHIQVSLVLDIIFMQFGMHYISFNLFHHTLHCFMAEHLFYLIYTLDINYSLNHILLIQQTLIIKMSINTKITQKRISLTLVDL